jgi:hypothetical protein
VYSGNKRRIQRFSMKKYVVFAGIVCGALLALNGCASMFGALAGGESESGSGSGEAVEERSTTSAGSGATVSAADVPANTPSVQGKTLAEKGAVPDYTGPTNSADFEKLVSRYEQMNQANKISITQTNDPLISLFPAELQNFIRKEITGDKNLQLSAAANQQVTVNYYFFWSKGGNLNIHVERTTTYIATGNEYYTDANG